MIALTAAGTEERRQLATYIGIDLAVVLCAAGSMAAVRLWLIPNPWIGFMVVLLLGAAGGLYIAMVFVRYDRCAAAVATFAAANWAVSITIAAISPFSPTVVAPVILLPVMVAVRYLNRSQLSALLGAAIPVCAAMAAAGSLPDLAGVQAQSPRWTNDVLAMVFVPAMTGLIALAAWQTHTALAARAGALWQSHTRLAAAADGVRLRIERDLSHTTQRRLATALDAARSARHLVNGHDEAAGDAFERLTTDLQQASAELRELAHGIYPPELAEHGLAAALRTASLRWPVPTTVTTTGLVRYRPEIENSVYFCCLEAVQDAATHAGEDTRVDITMRDRHGLWFEMRRYGTGCTADVIRNGPGFTMMTDRMGVIGGTLTVVASPRRGVRIRGHVPTDVLSGVRPDTPPDVLTTRPATAVMGILAGVWRLAARAWDRSPDSLTGRRHATTGIGALRAVTMLTGAIVIAAYPVAHPAWFLTVAAATCGSALLLLGAQRIAGRGDPDRAVAFAAVTFWVYALAVTLAAPATLPSNSLLVVMPVVLAASRLRGRRFLLVAGATVAVTCLVTVAGRFPPAVGIEPAPHPLLRGAGFVALVVLGTTVPSWLTWQNHVTLTRRAEELQASRQDLISASDLQRRQIERDLHDCAQQRLVAAALRARLAQRLLSTRRHEVEQVDPVIAGLIDDLEEASSELRDLAYGIHSPRLDEDGLEAALRAAAARSPLPTTVTVDRLSRYRPDIEVNVYSCCLEGLQNAIKHAGDDATITIELSGHNGLSFDIRDNGAGCPIDKVSNGHGFLNMTTRLAAIGGTLAVHTRPGHGVHLHGRIAHVPLAGVD
ncbi:MAG TPA: ATP-binding protein [Candidatus Limnocylindrales bacterium]|nr:ATP-binding protein [Candidatus Limnocylindrales bacterium]